MDWERGVLAGQVDDFLQVFLLVFRLDSDIAIFFACTSMIAALI